MQEQEAVHNVSELISNTRFFISVFNFLWSRSGLLTVTRHTMEAQERVQRFLRRLDHIVSSCQNETDINLQSSHRIIWNFKRAFSKFIFNVSCIRGKINVC